MNKAILILLICMLTIAFFIACSKHREISSIKVIRQSDNKTWTFSEGDTIDKFIKALNNKKKTNAKIDIREHDYVVNIYFTDDSNKEYWLWIDEDINVRGVLMDEETTWFIDKSSNSVFKELLK